MRNLWRGYRWQVGGALALAGVLAVVLLSSAEPAAARGQESTSAWSGVFTEAQAERGKETYVRECAACHLDDLLGDGIAPALVGASFEFRWSELSLNDMYLAIRTTMPQGAPASLSVRDYVDIVAYILAANDFPAGEEELPTDEDVLSEIIIDEQA